MNRHRYDVSKIMTTGFHRSESNEAESLPSLPDFSQPCCRKCRREMIVELLFQTIRLLHGHLPSPEESPRRTSSGYERPRLSPQRRRLVLCRAENELENISAQCIAQYKDVWRTWSPRSQETSSSLTFRGLLYSFQINFRSIKVEEPPKRPNILGSCPSQTPWTPAHCPSCAVWMNSHALCRCSADMECYPCSLSRLQGLFARIDNTRGIRERKPRSRARRRAFSLPVNLSGSHLPVEPPLTLIRRLIGLQSNTSSRENNLERLSSEVSFVLLPSLSDTGFNTALGEDRAGQYRPESLLGALLPSHLRFLPPTHYITFLHGLYGNAKDFARFRNYMLPVFPDLHCFVPDCYASKAMGGVELLTNIVREYLFLERFRPWGIGRLPTTPDLIRHLLPRDRSFPFAASRTSDGIPERSRVFISFVGHSLGGIIARSLVTLKELIRPRNEGSPAFTNFVTFASPHNGIYEAFGGLHVVSFLVPTGRDLMTASSELQRLAHPSSLLSLSHFKHLALYGNINNDYLVGPFTSLAIDPHVNRDGLDVTTGALPRNESSGSVQQLEEQQSMEFPICVKSQCIRFPRCPMEIDSAGFLMSQDPPEESVKDISISQPFERKCDEDSCVHITKSTAKRHNRLKWKTRTSLFDHFRAETQSVHAFLKASLPLAWDLSSSDGSPDDEQMQLSDHPADTHPIEDPSLESDFESFAAASGFCGIPLNEQKSSSSSPRRSEQQRPSINGSHHKYRRRRSRSASPVPGEEHHAVRRTITPLQHIRYFRQLPWRRFGVHIPSFFRAHACIIWHGRMDVWSLGEPIVQHFADEVFENPLSIF